MNNNIYIQEKKQKKKKVKIMKRLNYFGVIINYKYMY